MMKKLMLPMIFTMSLPALPIAGQNANDQVRIRVINAVQGSPAVSVALGSTQAFDNVAFKQITVWKDFPQLDDQTLKITLADGRQLKTTEEFSFDDDDEQYTILITPDTAGPNPKVAVLSSDKEDDDNDDVNDDQDEVEVTLINAAPEHKSLKLMVGDKTIERGVNYAQAGDDDAKAGPQTLKIIDSDKDMAVASQSVNLTGGSAVTVVVMAGGVVKMINDASPDQDLSSTTAGAATGATTGTQKTIIDAATTGTM